MSRQNERDVERARRRDEKKNYRRIPIVALSPEVLLKNGNEELEVWRAQYSGYAIISAFIQAKSIKINGLRQLGFTDEELRPFVINEPNPRIDELIYARLSGLDKNKMYTYSRLLKLEDPFFKAGRKGYTDDAIKDLRDEFLQRKISIEEYLQLIRTYSGEMNRVTGLYVGVLAKEAADEKRRSKKLLTSNQNGHYNGASNNRSTTISEAETPISDTPVQNGTNGEATTVIKPFGLTGKTLYLATKPWSTNPNHLVKLDTDCREKFLEQFTDLTVRHTDCKPSSLVRALEFFLQPDAFSSLMRSGLSYTPDSVDKKWVRVKRGNDRIGILPSVIENREVVEAVICAGNRSWIYDRLGRV